MGHGPWVTPGFLPLHLPTSPQASYVPTHAAALTVSHLAPHPIIPPPSQASCLGADTEQDEAYQAALAQLHTYWANKLLQVGSGCGAGMGYTESLTRIHSGKCHSLLPPGRRRLPEAMG